MAHPPYAKKQQGSKTRFSSQSSQSQWAQFVRWISSFFLSNSKKNSTDQPSRPLKTKIITPISPAQDSQPFASSEKHITVSSQTNPTPCSSPCSPPSLSESIEVSSQKDATPCSPPSLSKSLDECDFNRQKKYDQIKECINIYTSIKDKLRNEFISVFLQEMEKNLAGFYTLSSKSPLLEFFTQFSNFFPNDHLRNDPFHVLIQFEKVIKTKICKNYKDRELVTNLNQLLGKICIIREAAHREMIFRFKYTKIFGLKKKKEKTGRGKFEIRNPSTYLKIEQNYSRWAPHSSTDPELATEFELLKPQLQQSTLNRTSSLEPIEEDPEKNSKAPQYPLTQETQDTTKVTVFPLLKTFNPPTFSSSKEIITYERGRVGTGGGPSGNLKPLQAKQKELREWILLDKFYLPHLYPDWETISNEKEDYEIQDDDIIAYTDEEITTVTPL